MKTFLLILSALLLFLVTACSSSYEINSTSPTSDSSVLESNKFAAGKEADVIPRDDVVFGALDILLSADSFSWFNSRINIKGGANKTDVRKLIFNDDLSGGLDGTGLGFLGGAVVVGFYRTRSQEKTTTE